MTNLDSNPASSEPIGSQISSPVTTSGALSDTTPHDIPSMVADESSPIDTTVATGLARLLALSDDSPPQWPSQDLAEMLHHQLATSLTHELRNLEGVDPDHLRRLTESVSPVIHSFLDLFTHLNPPLKLLQYAKDFAKACRDDPERILPANIPLALYYACLVSARLRCHQQLTSMPPQDVDRGLAWTLRQEWMHPGLRPLFEQARRQPDLTSD